MSEQKKKFQQLLQELFQFDMADLDFGIYRIMNYKRGVIERWIQEDLPRAIEQELRQGALAGQGEAQKTLEEARRRVLETLGVAVIDAEGNLAATYCDTPLGKAYLETRKKAVNTLRSEALEAAVYNHLYAFFRRYYQDGDFISKRRYSKKERYAIPYNGEEVTLYWANQDQYYIKTAEHFTDYTWKSPNGVTVHFKLKAADVEQNNVKGEKRFFLPVLDEMEWQEAARTLTIPFEYRPLTKKEEITFGAKNQQEKIFEQARQVIPERLKKNSEALAALTAERRKDTKGEPVSYLEHHLQQYAARNTRDFFIHKDLRGFLGRELDFYLKNEVLNLDELEAAGEALSKGWFQLTRLIKRVGNAIIDFLAQIENFQKALWEKKKLVTETFYVITAGHVPQDFYGEIADCDAQWDEWKDLLHIDEDEKSLFTNGKARKAKRLEFLKSHPSLPVDTRHFTTAFTDYLLASFKNLDDATDGLLVHSENFQALNLLQEKYYERVKCVYIDPPYNTNSDSFLYKDSYQHSSWLTMMKNRLEINHSLLSLDGAFTCSIDDKESTRLIALLDYLFGENNCIEEIIWRKKNGGGQQDDFFVREHEYVLFYALNRQYFQILEKTAVKSKDGYPEYDEKKKKRYKKVKLAKWGTAALREDRPTMYFPVIAPDGEEVYPVAPDGRDGRWRYGRISVEDLIAEDAVHWEKDAEENWIPYEKEYEPSEGDLQVLKERSILYDLVENTAGTNELTHLWGYKDIFPNPKPSDLIFHLFLLSVPSTGGITLDFFAGSGTTGHAVISLNREDGGQRKFMLVEMGEYFDTVLLPRITKVIFSPEWKDGKPKRPATQEEFEHGPRIVKIIRLESHEDALNNIELDETAGQRALEFEDYLLKYMLQWEARQSATLLDVEKLQSPFSYKLYIHRDGETRAQAVDLPETFNYLLGLNVETRKACDDNGRRYLLYRGTLRNGRKAAVLWRETKDWSQADYERDAAFVAEHKLTDGADDIFVNGDSCIPVAQSLDGLFKARLFGGKEA